MDVDEDPAVEFEVDADPGPSTVGAPVFKMTVSPRTVPVELTPPNSTSWPVLSSKAAAAPDRGEGAPLVCAAVQDRPFHVDVSPSVPVAPDPPNSTKSPLGPSAVNTAPARPTGERTVVACDQELPSQDQVSFCQVGGAAPSDMDSPPKRTALPRVGSNAMAAPDLGVGAATATDSHPLVVHSQVSSRSAEVAAASARGPVVLVELVELVADAETGAEVDRLEVVEPTGAELAAPIPPKRTSCPLPS